MQYINMANLFQVQEECKRRVTRPVFAQTLSGKNLQGTLRCVPYATLRTPVVGPLRNMLVTVRHPFCAGVIEAGVGAEL